MLFLFVSIFNLKFRTESITREWTQEKKARASEKMPTKNEYLKMFNDWPKWRKQKVIFAFLYFCLFGSSIHLVVHSFACPVSEFVVSIEPLGRQSKLNDSLFFFIVLLSPVFVLSLCRRFIFEFALGHCHFIVHCSFRCNLWAPNNFISFFHFFSVEMNVSADSPLFKYLLLFVEFTLFSQTVCSKFAPVFFFEFSFCSLISMTNSTEFR